MKLFQFSLLDLIVIVTVVAAGCFCYVTVREMLKNEPPLSKWVLHEGHKKL